MTRVTRSGNEAMGHSDRITSQAVEQLGNRLEALVISPYFVFRRLAVGSGVFSGGKCDDVANNGL